MRDRPTIVEAAAQIRAGTLRPTQLVEQCLARIDQFEDRVHAWVSVDRQGALAAAARRVDELGAGKVRGPLHGIPLGIKDIIDVAGFPTRAGSPLTSEKPVAKNAPVVARLKTAGAIILGKTVTTEFACYDPPPTRNPWNLERTPGGSSSGSAAAVALGMCLGALGTQTGGSIIRPAAYCGIAGFKPTFGRVSRDGVVPVSESLDHVGVIATCAADLAILFETIADWPQRAADKGDTFTESKPPRLGFMAFSDGSYPLVREIVRQASAKLRQPVQAGQVHEVDSSIIADIPHWHGIVMAVEAAQYHRAAFAAQRDKFGPAMTKIIGDGLGRPADDYQEALAHQRQFREVAAAMLNDFDAVIMPATPNIAPDTTTTGDPKFNSPWSFAGVPTVTIPCGLSAEGMPVGLQLIGAAGSDKSLLSAAAWCERELGLFALPPMLAT